jgi:hypothetical protein
MKDGNLDGECNMQQKIRNAYKIHSENMSERDHVRHPGVSKRTILK